MARYMGFVRLEEGIEGPPEQMSTAMGEFMARSAAAGTLVDAGGLFGTEDSVNFVIRGGEMTRIDGPYAETKEVVGGWALMRFDDHETAIASCREMAQLHLDHWPGRDLTITLRQISEAPGAD
ncbi:YciI family protein [Nocardioides daejeonensis]|uniref:YciI family protein n=1 Tax=Nocardioides daejeonensis TaxID=1046556 RepID=UPI000D7428FB|nr:YciI family protein [Nocardioides daejeonensis]